MSKNMVEQVARALAWRRHGRQGIAPWWSEDGPQAGGSILLGEDEKEAFRDDARAVIEAMAEPQGEMIAAGGRLSHMKETTLQNLNAMAIYKAMITAALKP